MRSTANGQPVNKSRDNAVSRDRGSKNNVNGNTRDNKFSDRRRDSGGDWRGKHRHRHHHKHYPFFPPFGYYGYYSPYSDYYAEVYPDYPLGYGTTLGTSLERESNLEVNQYFVKPPAQPYPPAGDVYAEEQYDAAYEYYGPPPSGGRVIYIWTDENGVDNYVNDPDLIPDGQIDNVRIMGGE